MPTESAPASPLVCTLAYDRLCTFEYALCVEVFSLNRPEITGAFYRFETICIEPGPFAAAGGLSIDGNHDLSRLRAADLILVPGWRDPGEQPPAALLHALRDAHKAGARIASICSGVFVLAAAGLLSGRRATTHWRYVERLRAAYPDIEVLPDILYADDDDVLTSAGSAAGLDLCLHIVRKDHGAALANQLARTLVIPAHRDGGQTQYIPAPVAPRERGSLAPVLECLQGRLDEHWTLADMATLAAMSQRTLLRRFQESCGESPIAWLTRARIARARDLLETTDADLAGIAHAVGFGAMETFRLHFRRLVGTSPSRYRTQFRSGRAI